jgi:predicted O-methyltransferase YrrM
MPIQPFVPRTKDDLKDKCLVDLPYADSHGITSKSIGILQIVYDMIQIYKPKTCVCIGTGSGIVARVIREAQIASESDGSTYIIDLGETFGAMPDILHNETSDFRMLYPELKVFKGLSVPDGLQWMKDQNKPIDILWIDGDHSANGSKLDFDNYAPLVSSDGMIFMHDIAPSGRETNVPAWCGVNQTLKSIEASGAYDVLKFMTTNTFNFGCGLAMIKHREAIPQ